MSSMAHSVTRREVHHKIEEEGRAISWVREWMNLQAGIRSMGSH